jgi:hypothetical protein
MYLDGQDSIIAGLKMIFGPDMVHIMSLILLPRICSLFRSLLYHARTLTYRISCETATCAAELLLFYMGSSLTSLHSQSSLAIGEIHRISAICAGIRKLAGAAQTQLIALCCIKRWQSIHELATPIHCGNETLGFFAIPTCLRLSSWKRRRWPIAKRSAHSRCTHLLFR